MSDDLSFGGWLRRRRRMLDLTQEELAQRVGCAVVTIHKIETDERRPSAALAERLAACLAIAPDQREAFLHHARTLAAPTHLADPQPAQGLQHLQAHEVGATAPAAPARPPPQAPAYFAFLDQRHATHYRSEQVGQLAQAIRARENRLLVGLPGAGLSNLLRFLVARGATIVDQALFAYYDCNTQPGVPAEAGLFEALATQLCEQGLPEPLGGGAHGYARLQRLLERAGGDADARVVLVIDQADELAGQVGRGFYQQLKALTDLNKRTCLLMAVSPLLAARTDPDDLLFAGRRLAVGVLNGRDFQDAVAEEERRLGVRFAAPTRALLATLAGGHPGLLRALSSAAVAGALEGGDAEAAAERLLARDDVHYRCRKLWAVLPSVYRSALAQVAAGQAAQPQALSWLCDYGLLRQAGVPEFRSLVLKRFVLSQLPAPAAEPPGALAPVAIGQPLLDAVGMIRAGKVLKGGAEVPVSPLVLRLIYFLIRERRICTRDEIAGYVWQGVNAEGVSAAAIDDLIRQARQRLGGGYIKTYRGQGYEWAAPPSEPA